MRFDLKKIFFARFFCNKVTKELDGYELYWYLYSVTLVPQLYVFFKAFFKTVASYMLLLIRVLKYISHLMIIVTDLDI